MPLQFRQATRAQLRRQVGSLRDPDGFIYGTALAGTTTSVTLERAKRLATGALVGRVAYCVAGTGAGQSAGVSANAAGTGVLTLTPAVGVAFDATSVIELWPESLDPEVVNVALNQAVDDASPVVSVRVDLTSPTLDADFKVVTIPAGWTYIVDFLYRDSSGYWRKYTPLQSEDMLPQCGDLGYAVVGASVYLSLPVPSNIPGADMRLRGYRLPRQLDLDSDLTEVHPDFLVYTACLNLDSGMSEGPALDPEQHAGRSAAWLRQALVARTKLGTDWESNLVKVQV